jgi:hypothetical protein
MGYKKVDARIFKDFTNLDMNIEASEKWKNQKNNLIVRQLKFAINYILSHGR